MLITLLLKLFSLPKLLRLHFYPLFNRVLLKAHGVQVGTNIQIPGRIHWTIWGAICVLVIISTFHLVMELIL